MKKFLAAFLAVMMMLSLVVTAVVGIAAADDADAAKKVNQIETDDAKWTVAGGAMAEYPDGDKTFEAMTKKWNTNDSLIGYQFAYLTADALIDINGMTYVEFDMYITDAELVSGKTFRVDICSKEGAWDDHALQYCDRYSFVDGWNTIQLPLALFKDAKPEEKIDLSKICAVRVFFQDPNTKVPEYEEDNEEGFTIAINDLSFHNGLSNGGKELVAHAVTLSGVSAGAPGWSTGWAGFSENSPNDEGGTGSIAVKWAPGTKVGFANFMNYYEQFRVKGEEDKTHDLTNAKYFYFDLYLEGDSATVENFYKNITLNIELTSAGKCDSEEFQVQKTPSAMHLVAEGETAAATSGTWHTMRYEMTGMGSFKPAEFDYIRMFNTIEFTAGTEAFTVAIDNVHFEDAEGNTVAKINTEPDMNGWGGGSSMLIPKTEKVEEKDAAGNVSKVDKTSYMTTVGKTLGKGEHTAGGLSLFFANPDNSGLNAYGMKYLEFDLYVSDPSVFTHPAKNNSLVVELGSGGEPDQQEIAYTFYTNSDNSAGLKEGWTHILLPLSLMTAKTGGDCNMAYINWFRIYNQGTLKVEDEVTIAVDNVILWDGLTTLGYDAGGTATQAREEHSFKVKTDAEKPYIYQADQWSIENRGNQNRSTAKDGKNGFYYAFKLENAKTVSNVIFTAPIGGQFKLEVSTNGTTWETVYEFVDDLAAEVGEDGKQAHPNNLQTAVRSFDLTSYVVDTKGKTPALKGDTVYLHISDAYTEGGWGGLIMNDAETCLSAVYTIPPFQKTDRYVFTVGTETEAPFLTENAGTLSDDKSLRSIADGESIIYKYDLTRTTNLGGAVWNASLKGEYIVSISKDGTEWKDISITTEPTEMAYKNLSFDALDLNGTVEALYVRVKASGEGAAVGADRPVALAVNLYNGAALKTDKIEFAVNSEDEKAYLDDHGSQTKNDAQGNRRYADQDAYFIYQYDLSSYENPLNTINWSVTIGAEFLIEASADGKTWTQIGKATGRDSKALRTFTLPTGLVAAADASNKLFIKLSDAKPADGYGPCIYADTPVSLAVGYVEMSMSELDEIEMAPSANSIPINGCNAPWAAFQVDIENKIAGSASSTFTWKRAEATNTHVWAYNFTAVDASEMDTLEFEFYMSDAKFVDWASTGGQLELTSSGTCDVEESSTSSGTIIQAIKDAGAKEGWNHIEIKLSSLGQGCDWTRVNFMRIYWSMSADYQSADKDITLKMDNVRLTTRQKDKQDEANKIILEWKTNNPEAVKLFEALDAYKSESKINAENLETAKAAVKAAEDAYNAMDDAGKEAVALLKYDKALEKAQKAVADYEKAQEDIKNTIEANKALCDAIDALTNAIANLTDATIDQAKADYAAVKAQWDALDRSVKEILLDAGYYKKLQNADEAIATYVPGTGNTPGTGDTPGTDTPGTGDTTEPGGCKSVLTIGATAMMVLAGAWVAFTARKKED